MVCQLCTFNYYYYFHDNLPYPFTFFPSDLFSKDFGIITYVIYSLFPFTETIRSCPWTVISIHIDVQTFFLQSVCDSPYLRRKALIFFPQIEFHSKQDSERVLQQRLLLFCYPSTFISLFFNFPWFDVFSPFLSHFKFLSIFIAAVSETHTNSHSLSHMKRRLRCTEPHVHICSYRLCIVVHINRSGVNRCSVLCAQKFSSLVVVTVYDGFCIGGTSQLRAIRRMIYMCLPYLFQ